MAPSCALAADDAQLQAANLAGTVRLTASEVVATQVLPGLPLPVLPVWLTAHRELRASARLRTVFDFLAEARAAWGRGGDLPAST